MKQLLASRVACMRETYVPCRRAAMHIYRIRIMHTRTRLHRPFPTCSSPTPHVLSARTHANVDDSASLIRSEGSSRALAALQPPGAVSPLVLHDPLHALREARRPSAPGRRHHRKPGRVVRRRRRQTHQELLPDHFLRQLCARGGSS